MNEQLNEWAITEFLSYTLFSQSLIFSSAIAYKDLNVI